MSREWKPGDVALVEENGLPTLGVRCMVGDAAGWMMPNARANDYRWFNDSTGNVRPLRPLVVIDAEDREQVERLANLRQAIWDGETPHTYVSVVQAALREYADPKPPRPEEPTGLGAVVEDARGVRWVRAESAEGMENPWQATLHVAEPDRIRQLPYAAIDAVRVLSEGVQP